MIKAPKVKNNSIFRLGSPNKVSCLSSQPLLSLEPGEIAVRIRDGALTIGVIGLGWMGLPTACLSAESGARVLGADMNPKVVERVNKGDSPIDETGLCNR